MCLQCVGTCSEKKKKLSKARISHLFLAIHNPFDSPAHSGESINDGATAHERGDLAFIVMVVRSLARVGL